MSLIGRAMSAGVRRRWLVFGGLALVVVVSDQVTKAWIDASFVTNAPPTPIVDGFIRIAKTYNTGGIFGLFGSSAPVLAIASIAVIALIVVYHARTAKDGPWLLTLALGLLLGGALGNFIDRIRHGYVIDFVDMGIGDLRWWAFNVADASISISIVVLFALSFLGDRWQTGRVEPARPPASAPDRAG